MGIYVILGTVETNSEFRKILGVAVHVDTAPVYCNGERKAQLGGLRNREKGASGALERSTDRGDRTWQALLRPSKMASNVHLCLNLSLLTFHFHCSQPHPSHHTYALLVSSIEPPMNG
jgi:hypothetical protein